MTWDEFAAAWYKAFDGYDLKQASGVRQSFMRAIHKMSGVVRVKTATTMQVSVVCSISVPLLAWVGGQWAAIAALTLLLGQVADAMTSALAVRFDGVTRLKGIYQSLVERFAEVCWFLAFLALGARLAPVVLCAFFVWAQEYLRARVGGPTMRRSGSSTVGDRHLRIWLVVLALLLAAVISHFGHDVAAGVVTMVLLVWVVLGLIGIAQLLAIIRRALA